MLYEGLRPFLFRLEPETAHDVSLRALALLGGGPARSLPPAPRTVMGLQFPNPVGLAAGLDKNADYIDPLAKLGFGFIEVGTVTPRAQPGNPRPRMFRLPAAQALINRMGFNNHGVEYLLQRMRMTRFQGIIGINIGKNASTPAEEAVTDYLAGLQAVYRVASYITVNISSPNTPGLRDLQYGDSLQRLLAALKQRHSTLQAAHGRYTPLVVKVAPDLADEHIPRIAQALLHHGIDGLIATNTTFSRAGVEGLPHADETGGLSGAPLTRRATEVVARFYDTLGERLPIIAAGGIMTAADAVAKVQAGAKLVQVYTGLIYRGPRLLREIAGALQNV